MIKKHPNDPSALSDYDKLDRATKRTKLLLTLRPLFDLPAKHACAVFLYEYLGLSCKAIAHKKIKLPTEEGEVYQLLQDAKKKVRCS